MRRSGGWRPGFTLVELVVALTVSSAVLLGARALWESLVVATSRITRETAAADARANGERLLGALFGRLEVGTDHAHEFAGDERTVIFTTWCDVPAGWQERCDARVAIEPVGDSTLALLAHLSTGDVVTLRQGIHAGALRYLNDPAGRGVWFRVWGHGITAPLAVGVITDGDTTIVRIGERG